MNGQEQPNFEEIDSWIREANDIPPEEKTPNSGDDIDAEPENQEALDLEATNVARWRAAKSLLVLRDQVNRKAPNRSKASDGTIGDTRHASQNSDHNPWVKDGNVGVVTALDITHDPNDGCDANAIAKAIRDSRDVRVKYIIWNRRIANSSPIGGQSAWTWRSYTGSNPHTGHIHISVKSNKPNYDSTAAWSI